MTSEPHSIRALFEQARRPTSKYDTYYDAYQEILARYRGENVVVIEVGVQGGGSLEVWRRYFGKESRIIGVELNPVLKSELERDGFEIFVGDQQSDAFWEELYGKVGMVDVVIDDGGHTNKQTAATIRNAISNVKDGGMIIVEDSHVAYMGEFGNPSKSSIVERTKYFVDIVNARSCRVRQNVHDPWGVSNAVQWVQYFESIIALKIDRTKCRGSARTYHGSEGQLSSGQLPEDYRRRRTMRNRVGRWVRGNP